MQTPKVILLISGKRKCGKDFIAEILKDKLAEKCCLIRISEPIKSSYAEKHRLDLKEMMSDSPYKEQHRLAMIKWSDEIRKSIPGYFCEAACSKAPEKDIWIVCDIRRGTDIEWFQKTFGDIIKTVRITADNDVRKSRGWKYTDGVDNVTSECDLDDYKSWELLVENNNEESCSQAIQKILELTKAE